MENHAHCTAVGPSGRRIELPDGMHTHQIPRMWGDGRAPYLLGAASDEEGHVHDTPLGPSGKAFEVVNGRDGYGSMSVER